MLQLQPVSAHRCRGVHQLQCCQVKAVAETVTLLLHRGKYVRGGLRLSLPAVADCSVLAHCEPVRSCC